MQMTLAELADSNQQLSTAIGDAISGKKSEAEKTWIERIENLRGQMNTSSEELEVIDYGAGSSDLNLTDEEMYRGRIVHRTVGEICGITSRTAQTALLLFRLIRELKPCACIELGTSVGISACYQAAALMLNGSGRLITLEGAEAVASVAVRNFRALRLDNIEVVTGRFQEELPRVLSAHPAVEYAFIDGHHNEDATVGYFDVLRPALAHNAVLIFDDIRWSTGMHRAWDKIRRHEQVRVSVDLGSMGLVSVATNH